MNQIEDTIFALSSPPGRSAISIIRVSGKDTFKAMKKLTKKNICEIKIRKTFLSNIYNINNNLIDRGVVVLYQEPNSYTGENLAEISTHGNPVIVDSIFDTLTKLNLRLANPGEFTSRAYHNNKIDLIQAESTLSVINAKSLIGVQSSLLGVHGQLTKRLQKVRNLIVLSLAELEYELDISESDNKDLAINKAKKTTETVIKDIVKLIKTHEKSSIYTEGAKVVIVGEPNVGKSTLLNSLTNQDKAIVTDVPGTTRDTIESHVYFSNYPVLLIDTAGLRKTKNKIENIGITKTKQEILSADVVYNLQNNTLKKAHKTDPSKTIVVFNKSDLMTRKEKEELQRKRPEGILISAKNKDGLDKLKTKTEKILRLKTGSNESLFLSSKRQQAALIKSKEHLAIAIKKDSLSELEVVAHNLRMALNEFDWVLGKTTTDELLNSVFSNFCVGK